jgi:hypothetical protein
VTGKRGAGRERAYGPADELVVLHLSDTQFGRNHLFGGNGLTAADRDRDSLFARLHEDLAKLASTRGLWPDLVVVTGDLAETGMGSEFDRVVECFWSGWSRRSSCRGTGWRWCRATTMSTGWPASGRRAEQPRRGCLIC